MSNYSTDLAITPKRLGLTAVSAFCARCFWFLLHLKFHPPFSFFGGAIFKQMEKAQIAVVDHLLATDSSLPEEFEPLCDLVERVDFPRDWRRFQHRLKSGVLLYGEPDDICKASDGSLVVIDHKTADPKGGKDRLLECYRCQIIGYALIAESGLKLGRVSKGALLYWTANHQPVVENPGRFYHSKQLWMPFDPKPLAIDIDYTLLDAPLKEAVRIWQLPTPPERSQKCDDCRKLEALFAIEAGVEKLLSSKDQRVLASSGNSAWVRNAIVTQLYRRDERRRSSLAELQDEANQINFADDGMVTNWERYYEDAQSPDLPVRG